MARRTLRPNLPWRLALAALPAASAATMALVPSSSQAALPLGTRRVSVSSAGTQANGASEAAGLSETAARVVWASWADNLVAGDINGVSDVFLRDLDAGQTALVSVGLGGGMANGPSSEPCIASDGNSVAFESHADNLVAADRNGRMDVFVYDRGSETTRRVSVATDGTEGNHHSELPAISADGRYVAFDSLASNLVSDDTNGTWDVFVHDRSLGTTERVSVASDGGEGNGPSELAAISADGRYVAFQSAADNLVAADNNGFWDVFVHDRTTGATSCLSVTSEGVSANGHSFMPSLSANGRYAAFCSSADNLVTGDTNDRWDVFLRDRSAGHTRRVSVSSDGAQGNGHSGYAAISANGRYIAFDSEATNLVSEDTNAVEDVFVHDRLSGYTERLSLADDGGQASGSSASGFLSGDGRCGSFVSDAANLVAGDTNGEPDVFIRCRWRSAPWDVNGDGVVNSLDVGRIGLHWQQMGPPGWIPEDVNRDGVVNALDLGIIGLHWQQQV